MANVCQLGRRFARCSNPGHGICQYCGRAFCDLHTGAVVEHEEVCARDRCRRKFDDVRAHQDYRHEAIARNNSGICGDPSCQTRVAYECSLCEALFCESHLRSRMYPSLDGPGRAERPVSTCPHCWERRKLWSRR